MRTLDRSQAGIRVGGVVVEYVLAKGVSGLRPAFLAELRSLVTSNGLLLFEDAVMTGLRCGAPFVGARCPGARPDFVAIGKAWSCSGVVAHRDASKRVPWETVSKRTEAASSGEITKAAALEYFHENWLHQLNGFFTMRISCADALRASAVLDAVHSRQLMRNARTQGPILRAHLQAHGVHVWGAGLLLGYDSTSGILINVWESFDRLLPPLSFGEHGEDWREIRVVGGADAPRIAERALAFTLGAEPTFFGSAEIAALELSSQRILHEARQQLKYLLESKGDEPEEMSPGISSSDTSSDTSND